MLRHHGVPARARVGFASYFTPDFHEDHWVCEYDRGDRWRLLDGAWFVAGNVVRDLAALNKREMLAWDVWGIMHEWGRDQPIPDAAIARLDAVAALTAPSPPDWTTVREAYERDDALRVPPVVTSKGRPVAVDV